MLFVCAPIYPGIDRAYAYHIEYLSTHLTLTD